MEGNFKTIIRIDDKFGSKGELMSVMSDQANQLFLKVSGHPGSYYYVQVSSGNLLAYFTGAFPTFKLVKESEMILLEVGLMPMVRIEARRMILKNVPFVFETFPEILNGSNYDARINHMINLLTLNNQINQL